MNINSTSNGSLCVYDVNLGHGYMKFQRLYLYTIIMYGTKCLPLNEE